VSAELRMINDIARQFRHRPAEEAADEIAGHVRRFWDPRMRARLRELVDSVPDSLDPLALAAARRF
jgi:formate dehydrogenase subunit delta